MNTRKNGEENGHKFQSFYFLGKKEKLKKKFSHRLLERKTKKTKENQQSCEKVSSHLILARMLQASIYRKLRY